MNKEIIDKILVANLFIIISGSLLFIFAIIGSIAGYDNLYDLFLYLWYPLFIPSLSIFFTSILVELIIKVWSNIKNK